MLLVSATRTVRRENCGCDRGPGLKLIKSNHLKLREKKWYVVKSYKSCMHVLGSVTYVDHGDDNKKLKGKHELKSNG